MQIVEWLSSYGGWSWVVAGVVLLALELVMPGGFFLWIGMSGIVTGVAALLWPAISWPFQFLIFGVLSLVTILGWLTFMRGRQPKSDRPLLNERASRLIGQELMLNEPIRDGSGRVPIGDSIWRITGPDLAAGQRVRIVGAEGAVLKVEAV